MLLEPDPDLARAAGQNGHLAVWLRSWTGVSAFDRAAFKIIVKSCLDASRVREDLADIIMRIPAQLVH